MSAFFVSKTDIDLIVSALIEYRLSGGLVWGRIDHGNATDVGKMLWTENLKSLAARYPDRPGEHADHAVEIEAYKFKQYCQLKPGPLAKVVHCYEYQACEHAGWQDSMARRLCRAIISTIVCRMPGYEDAPWGISDPKEAEKVCSPGVVSAMSLVGK